MPATIRGYPEIEMMECSKKPSTVMTITTELALALERLVKCAEDSSEVLDADLRLWRDFNDRLGYELEREAEADMHENWIMFMKAAHWGEPPTEAELEAQALEHDRHEMSQRARIDALLG